ncbi:MAG: hypothetical protein GY729_01040 [Desulfobacteraceae bacterium]|nr:hypothetical protein [Desulfobacteraceae bacterium]
MKTNVVVAGWGQVIQPKDLIGKAKEPIDLMVDASAQAARIMRSKSILQALDSIMVVKPVSRHYSCPDKQLAQKLGATPKLSLVSEVGGNSPQTLVNMAAAMITNNELDSVLIVGAEAYVQREPNGKRVENALFSGVPDHLKDDSFIGATPFEETHGMMHPIQGFPLFETAFWAASGLDLETYLLKVGKMWEKFGKTAQNNPFAWSKDVRTAEQIITPGPSNRPIAFPYTKYMTSFVTVDMGAAIILMSEKATKPYKQNNLNPVYYLGGGDARDRQRFMIEKSVFTQSPPLKAAVDMAIKRSSLPLEKIECFDLYSCFPCAVTMAKKMIGISDEDMRPLTLTGGLGFFGGPGNNYSLHGIATMAEYIAHGKKNTGLVTSLGWFMHKHAAGIYGNDPSKSQFEKSNLHDPDNLLCGNPPVKIIEQASGKGIIETYTVVYDFDHKPVYGLIYGLTSENERFIARTMPDPQIFKLLTTQNCVGRSVTLQFDSLQNLNIADIR